jgi:hypothetical protein
MLRVGLGSGSSDGTAIISQGRGHQLHMQVEEMQHGKTHAQIYHNSCIKIYKKEHSAIPYRPTSSSPATHAREESSTVENMIEMGKNMPEYLPSDPHSLSPISYIY